MTIEELAEALDLSTDRLIEMSLIIDNTIEYYFNPKTPEECKVNFLSAPKIAEASELIIKSRMTNFIRSNIWEDLLITSKEANNPKLRELAIENIQKIGEGK